MAHHTHSDQDHAHNHHHDAGNLKIAFILNAVFTVIELFGGVFTGSMAILSDAIHDLGDTVVIGSSLFFERYSHKAGDARFSYGYRRFSPFSALINSLIILAGSILILYETIPRLWHPQEVNAPGMIGLAIAGVLFNGLAVFRLKGSKGNSLNHRAVMLHLMEDVLGWIAVLLGSVMIYFTGWMIIDSILSLGVTSYVLYNVAGNLRDIFGIFLQTVPQDVDMAVITKKILAIDHVKSVHNLHSWTMDGDYNVLTVHVVIKTGTNLEHISGIKQKVLQIISAENIRHSTVQIELESEICGIKENQ